jgi:hypothetical protein
VRFPKIAVIRSGFPGKDRRQTVGLLVDGELFPYPTFGGYVIAVDRETLPGVNLTLAADSVEVQDEVDGARFEELTAAMREKMAPRAWLVYHAYNGESSIALVGLAGNLGAAQKLTGTDRAGDNTAPALEWCQESETHWVARTGDNGAYYATEYPIHH